MSQGFTKELVFGPGIAGSGANSDITSMTGLTGALRAPTAIASSAGLSALEFSYVPSAVNHLIIFNNAAGSFPGVTATGTDASVGMALRVKNSYIILSDSTGTIAPTFRFMNAANNQYTGLKAADAQGTSLLLTLPAVDGTTQAPIITDASGNLSFLPGPWVDFSGTIGYTGFTGAVTTTYALQKRIGNTVYINISASGTSNATTFTITGLPFTAARAASFIPTSFATNAGTNSVCNGSITGTTLTLFNSVSSAAWTNSGGKGFVGQFFYEIA